MNRMNEMNHKVFAIKKLVHFGIAHFEKRIPTKIQKNRNATCIMNGYSGSINALIKYPYIKGTNSNSISIMYLLFRCINFTPLSYSLMTENSISKNHNIVKYELVVNP